MVPVTTKEKDYPIYDMEKIQAMFQSPPISHNCGYHWLSFAIQSTKNCGALHQIPGPSNLLVQSKPSTKGAKSTSWCGHLANKNDVYICIYIYIYIYT